LLLITVVPGAAGNSFSSEAGIFAVWARPDENRMTTLLYAGRQKGNWSKPTELAVTRGLHVTPVIAADTKNTVWIIWIEQTVDENILRYARIHNGRTETGRVASAGNEQSYAPAIVIDSHETPWIAWSGVKDKFADIYSSRWNGKGWEPPVMVNKKNDTPDITPILGLNDQKIPWVSWFGITEQHSYVQFVAGWNNGQWNVDKNTLPSIDIGRFIEQRMGIEIQLPEQAGHRLMGAVFAASGKEIQSISERFISFQPPRGQR
jgi:hypothetical protein